MNFVLEENDTNAKNKINQANAPEYEILSTADRLTAFDKTFAGTTYYAYQAEDSKTVWGDNATLGSVSRWFNITNDNEVYEVTVFVLCTVTFDSQGGSAVASLTNVRSGSGIIAPTAPTLDGKTFNGWYKEAACTNAWDFSTDTVTADTTLYAKWVD